MGHREVDLGLMPKSARDIARAATGRADTPELRVGRSCQQMNVDQALERLMERAGSDLLISSGSRPRIRKDGKLEELEGDAEVLMPADTERMVRDVLDADQLRELEKKRHVDFSFTWKEKARIRGNIYYQRNSLAAAFRLLPLEIPSFEMLGIPESVHRLLERQHGLLLVTGPTGSGKSTTQAAMIDHINATRPFHIITIEDPIEYVHKHKMAIVDQRQVGEDTPSFSEGLRGAFREDPDVVLIGEMRDLETISAAVSIAEAGHLVMGTLHTNDAPQAIDRIIDSYLGAQQQQVRIQLASCLAGVIYQQLLPAIGGGRVAAFEVLIANTAIRSMIKEGRTDQIRSVLQTGLREGSQTLERALSQLMRAGLITERDARSHSVNPSDIRA